MLNLRNWRRLQRSEIGDQIAALRLDTLRLIMGLVTVGYLIWHIVATVFLPVPSELPYRSLFLLVATGQTANWLSLTYRPRLAVWCFLVTSAASIVAAIWLLQAPVAAMLIPVLALAAVILVHPAAGVATSAVTIGLVDVLRSAGPFAFVGEERLVETAVACVLSVAVVWALDRNLVVAIDWSLHSYDQALKSTQEAQSHRAQLVQALKQLDNAYYRLERASTALEMAWKAAEAAERSKSEFVTNISHELRTPLNLIAGFSEMIATSPEAYGVPLAPAYRSDVFAIYRSAQHLLTLTGDVLDLARVGAGRLALAREPVNLGQTIRDACDMVREYVAAKRLELTIDVEPTLPVVEIDRLRVRQVLLNLLTNAARFTERGGIRVVASPDEAGVVVRVSDTGRGIGPTDLPHVFDEFYHDEGERSALPNSFGGIGLGLPISRRLVELHGGTMGVESKVGSGTTFWFALPTLGGSGSSPSNRVRPVRLPALTADRERVLVLAGSDGYVATYLQRHLRGCRLIPVPDIAQAVAASAEARASAILVDADSPLLDCLGPSPVPVLRLPLPHSDRIAAELGVTACLAKPISRQDLWTAIDRLERPLEKVVVVDDDQSFVRLVSLMLRSHPIGSECRILAAHNGQEALEVLAANRPDLVLLDLVMPGMGGSEVVAAMRADPRLAEVPVFILSGHDQPEWEVPLRGELGVQRAEGFRIEELLGAIEGLLAALDPPRGYLDSSEQPS